MGKSSDMAILTKISVILLIIMNFKGISGKRFDHDLVGEPSLDDVLASCGYSLQRYEYVVSDGYILTLFRIKQDGANKLKPILFIHGLTGCSDSMFIAKNYSAPIYFVKRKFDIWLLSNRGAYESLGHVKWNSSIDEEYWKFSLHEIGMVDIPSAIDKILSINIHEKVALIGHSAGSTSIFVTLADRPEYNKKVAVSFHWGSSIYHEGCHQSLKVFCIQRKLLIDLFKSLGFIYSVPPTYWKNLLAQACRMDIMAASCNKFYEFIYDVTSEDPFPYIFSKSMCGGSFQEFEHIAQIGQKGVFARLDFGVENNLKVYNTSHPPLYHLGQVTSPVIIWCGSYDRFCTAEGLKRVSVELPNVSVAQMRNFGHVDFVVSKVASKIVFPRAAKILHQQKYWEN